MQCSSAVQLGCRAAANHCEGVGSEAAGGERAMGKALDIGMEGVEEGWAERRAEWLNELWVRRHEVRGLRFEQEDMKRWRVVSGHLLWRLWMGRDSERRGRREMDV